MRKLRLILLEGKYAICRLDPDSELPDWAAAGEFQAITRTPDELSVICLQKQVPRGINCQAGWKLLKIEGPFNFDEIGVLASLTAPLADAQISLLTISTYDTDYLLIQQENFSRASQILEAAGHQVV